MAARKEALHDAASAGQIDRGTLKRLVGEIDEQLYGMHAHPSPPTSTKQTDAKEATDATDATDAT